MEHRPATPARPGTSSDVILFFLPSFIWGTTWLAIKFQLGVVAPEVSVAWRFALASVLLLAWCLVRRVPLRFTAREHGRLLLLGFLLFGLNYVLVYRAEQHLASGLVAVVFSFLVFWNLIGARVFFGTPAPPAVVAGAVVGVAGVALLFWPEVTSLRAGGGEARGLVLALVATLFASAGNLYSQRLFATGMRVVPATAVAMGYASLSVMAWCGASGIPFTFDARPAYVLSLAYLAVFGSVVAFVAFLTLITRIGAGRSGYTAAVIPLLAMLATTAFEGYRWSAAPATGMLLVLGGTVLVLRAKERALSPLSDRPVRLKANLSPRRG